MDPKNPNENWIPVLRTGTFTGKDSLTGGPSELVVDRAKIDRIVANYNTELAEVPFCIGHPKTDDPAFGWVEKFKRVGDVLMALPGRITPEFKKAVQDGFYKYVSAKVRPNDTIAHIGFLGAAPPAVAGLGPVTLAEGDSGVTVELAQADLWVEKNLFRRIRTFFGRIRDSMVAEGGVEAADKVLTQDDLDYFTQAIDNLELQTPQSIALSEPGQGSRKDDMDPKVLQQQLDAANASLLTANTKIGTLTTDLAAANEKASTATSALAALKAQVEKEKTDARATEFSEYCDAAVKQGKIKAGDKRSIVALMELAFKGGEIELTEGGATSKKSALEYLKNLIAVKKPSVTFTEIATPERVAPATELSDATEISNAIMEYQAAQKVKGITVSVVDALAHVKAARQ